MPIYEPDWNSRRNAVHIVIEAPFTANEWLEATKRARDLIHTGGCPAFILHEYHLPSNYAPQRALNYLYKVNELGLHHDDRIRGVIEVGLSGFMKSIARVYVRTYGVKKTRFVGTLAEARQIIGSQQAGV